MNKKRRIISMLGILILTLSVYGRLPLEVNASDTNSIKSDGSYLLKTDSSTGTTKENIFTRGEHLMDGECSITKSGRGRIYVYASTTGDHIVDYISTVIYVDQFNEKTGKWEQIDCWQVEDYNKYYVSTSKSMVVDRGYYYRVHADHVAGMNDNYPYDQATSLTDGIWID